jgi:hypothetical protein
MKKLVCWCGAAFGSVLSYGTHLQEHPTKCTRCKQWFSVITGEDSLVQHDCKPLRHMED